MPLLNAKTKTGSELPEVACQFQLSHFKRGDAATIHTDVEAAKREGLPAPVATGPQVAALIFRQLRMAFGEGWIEGGRCALDFRRPVYVNDFCVARGRVTGVERIGDHMRLSCDVWIENHKGEKVIAGTASGLVTQ